MEQDRRNLGRLPTRWMFGASMIFPRKKLWLPGRNNKQPCLRDGYLQSRKDMMEYKNRFRFNPLAKVADMFIPRPLRMSPGYPCCCEPIINEYCNCSVFDNSQSPCCIKITITDIVEDTCGSCSSLNNIYGAYRVYNNHCIWKCNFPAICSISEITCTAYQDGSDYKIKVELGEHRWEKNFGTSKPSYDDLNSSIELLHVNSGGTCDSSDSSCFIIGSTSDDCECPSTCLCCNGGIPSDLSITIENNSGSGNCGCWCGIFNDTWIVEFSTPCTFINYISPFQNFCAAYWNSQYSISACGYSSGESVGVSVGVGFNNTSNKRKILVSIYKTIQVSTCIYSVFSNFELVTDANSPYDCYSFDSLEIPYLEHNYCDPLATCYLSSL